jgi:hypothetical protein
MIGALTSSDQIYSNFKNEQKMSKWRNRKRLLFTWAFQSPTDIKFLTKKGFLWRAYTGP